MNTPETNESAMVQPTEVELEGCEHGIIAEIIKTSQAQINALIAMISAQRKLQGQWALSPDFKKLVKQG